MSPLIVMLAVKELTPHTVTWNRGVHMVPWSP